MNAERTKTGVCPGCMKQKGVRKDGKMAAHSIGEGPERKRCPGYGQLAWEAHIISTTDTVFGANVGEKVLATHSALKCKGQNCVIHNPSDHHMVGWQMHYRRDTGVMERTCPHGVGHPDPDDTAWHVSEGRNWTSVHGCDGCCNPDPTQRRPV
jgi:hypothetical protein